MKAKSKWKVGDLVTLSARGVRIEANWNLWRFQDNKDGSHQRVTEGFGVVTRISTSGAGWPVLCSWFGSSLVAPGSNHAFKDYELKRYKSDKKCP